MKRGVESPTVQVCSDTQRWLVKHARLFEQKPNTNQYHRNVP